MLFVLYTQLLQSINHVPKVGIGTMKFPTEYLYEIIKIKQPEHIHILHR